MRKAAALLIALLCPALAAGAEFDAASSRATKTSARALAWSHALGGGSDRILTVGVTVEDNQDKDPGLSVTFNGLPMSAVPAGIAAMTRQRRMLRTQLFYLLEASLPAAGSYRVAVRLTRTVGQIGGGAVSLGRLAQRAPEAVVTANSGHVRDVSTTLATLTPRAWVVEAVGSDADMAPAPLSGQTARYSAVGRGGGVGGDGRGAVHPDAHVARDPGQPPDAGGGGLCAAAVRAHHVRHRAGHDHARQRALLGRRDRHAHRAAALSPGDSVAGCPELSVK